MGKLKKNIEILEYQEIIKELEKAPLTSKDKEYFNKVKKTLKEMFDKNISPTKKQKKYLDLMYEKYESIILKRKNFDYSRLYGKIISINPYNTKKIKNCYKITLYLYDTKEYKDIIINKKDVVKLNVLKSYVFVQSKENKKIYNLKLKKKNKIKQEKAEQDKN